MPKFRKNPIVVEARQLGNTHEEDLDILAWCSGSSHDHPNRCDLYEVPTLEGVMIADMGDWIIKGIKGEFYPVKEEIFKETYTPEVARSLVPAPPPVPVRQVTPSLKQWVGKVHCMDAVKLMAQLPTDSISVAVTSPPYNLKNSTGNGMKDGRGGKWANAALINGYEDHNDCMPHDEYVAWQRQCLRQMLRVLRPDCAIFYNHKWRVQAGLLQDRSDIVEGFPVRQIIIWKRKGGINFNPGYFLPTYEVIYLIAKPDFKLTPKANAQGDVWEIPQARDNEHPAPFPIELAQRCIAATPSGPVLDPFMGSGTTALAAEILNREWIGAEISPKYCAMAEKRLKAHAKSKLNDTLVTVEIKNV